MPEALRTDAAARTLLLDLQASIAEADAGDLVPHDEVIEDMRDRFKGRVPSDLQIDSSSA